MNIVVTGASNGIGFPVALQLSADKKKHCFSLCQNSEKIGYSERGSLPSTGKARLIPLVGDISKRKMLRNGRWNHEWMYAHWFSCQQCRNVRSTGLLFHSRIVNGGKCRDNVLEQWILSRMLLPLLEGTRKSENANWWGKKHLCT